MGKSESGSKESCELTKANKGYHGCLRICARSYLGEFELLVLLALIQVGEDAYGVPISR